MRDCEGLVTRNEDETTNNNALSLFGNMIGADEKYNWSPKRDYK